MNIPIEIALWAAGGVISGATTILLFWVNALSRRFSLLEERDEKIFVKLHEIELLVAGQYATKDQFDSVRLTMEEDRRAVSKRFHEVIESLTELMVTLRLNTKERPHG